MITDNETNFLYLADCLKKNKYSAFLKRLQNVLDNRIEYDFLPHTKDIWAVDYMPIQIDAENFVQFNYNPDYLKPKRFWKSISDVPKILNELPNGHKIQVEKSEIKIDGGNVVRTKDKVIMCDKVFQENPKFTEKTLIKKLEILFKVDKIIFVPWQKEVDVIGHADGMVRFLDDRTVLINDYDYYEELPEFVSSFKASLHNAGLVWEEMPYNPYDNKSEIDATGIYINYLQMENVVIVPTFKQEEDDEAIKFFESKFPNVLSIDSKEISIEGGILNCITWNIKKQ